MYRSFLRLAALLVLALSLCVLSGAVTTVLAVAQDLTHAGACCPPDRTAAQPDDDCCVSPECQCLSCLTIDFQGVEYTFRAATANQPPGHDSTAILTGGNYRTIDYPPEVA